MHHDFTLKNACQTKRYPWFAKVFILFLLLVSQAVTLFAHTVDYFNSCGYICTGSTLSVTAHVSNTNSSSKYNWQYRDNSNTWKCFVNGNNTINGVVSSVSGVSATGALSTSPALSISNAQSNLENVEVRLLIADGGTPCASNASYAIYGGDKNLRLHVLSGSDCSSISTYCSMGGCIGNTLSNGDGYYGGFETGSGSIGAASTDYLLVTSNSSNGNYAIVNNAQQIYSSFGSFAPHSGNYMLYADGSATASKRIWYKTVSVIQGSMYQFSAWIANASSTNNQKAIAHLKIAGVNSAEATKTVTATAGDWQYVKVDYTASQSGSVTISITDDNTSTADNDFVIDDICFVSHGQAPTLTLGNQVWNDYDGDGKRDDNEPGIPGATVSLYTDNNSDNLPDGAAVKTTVTDALGHYQFTNLTEGRYIVSLPILPGYQQSPNTSTQATSPNPDNNVDNDDNLVRLVGPNGPGGIVYTNAITLTAGQEPITDGDDANGNNTLDLAECGNSFIGDFVWNDLNGNGIQDAGEPGINGVPVTITFSDGRTATTTTLTYNAANNANAPQFDGYYNFPNLGPGTYKISFATPVGLHASPSNAGSNDAKDSDPVNGGPVTVTIAANQSDFTIDAGFTSYIAPPPPPTCPNLSVGNMVFNDANDNGVKDANEQGIGGLTVKLYADNDGNNVADGAAVSTIMTAADGTYYFGNLSAGKYIVGVTLTDSLVQEAKSDATPDDNKDNDNNGVKTVNGEVFSNYITLSAGDEPISDGSDNNSNLTLDFGLQLKADTCTNHCQCHNDCNHTGCGHANCGHNSCKNDCNHTGCGHANCGHNSCKNDCNHTGCGHANCGHSSTNGDCAGTSSTKGYFGGFEAGSDNFSTSTGKTDLRYGLPRNGSFETVKKSSDAGGNGYLNLSPHAGSYMMIAHTSSDATDNIWSTTVNVVPGKTYTFTIWMANAKTDPVNGFAVTLNAADKVLTKGYADYKWGKLSATYTIPQGVTSVEFSVKDPYPEFSASHFLALDDICISTDNSSNSASSVSESKVVSPVYPNPAATNFTLNVTAAKQGTAVVNLISMSGKTIFTQNCSVSSGSNAIAINRIKDITGGTYNVQVIVDNQVYNQIMVISR